MINGEAAENTKNQVGNNIRDYLKLNSPLAMWILAGGVAIGIFILCFYAINYVGQPDEGEKELEVEMGVVATDATNAPLLDIARKEGWVEASATELTTQDAARIKTLGDAFKGSQLERFDEFRFFIGLEQIEEGAFAGSNSLKSITIPASVFDIKNGALADCPALESIKVDTANTHYDSRNDCQAIICGWKGKLMVVAGCRNTKIPSSARFIAPKAYKGCRGLTAISFPEKFDEIGEEAFSGCADLAEVAIPQGVDNIEAATFKGCTSLSKVELPKSIKKIKAEAFAGCTSLQTIISPKKFPAKVEKSAFSAFTAIVYVPKDELNTYYTSPVWKDFKTFKELP